MKLDNQKEWDELAELIFKMSTLGKKKNIILQEMHKLEDDLLETRKEIETTASKLSALAKVLTTDEQQLSTNTDKPSTPSDEEGPGWV